MKTIHLVPGTGDISNGMAVVAYLLAREQGDAEVVDLRDGLSAVGRMDVEEVWVHGMWLPREWLACMAALRSGRRLVRMTHGGLSPVYRKCQSPLKKRLVSPVERYLLRSADRVVATCEAEAGWIRAYEPRAKSIEVTDLKRFFNLGHMVCEKKDAPHLLYLGRRHPLKGLECLEQAVEGISGIELRIVSNAFGEEKARVWEWCDVLVLPTLSDNFGLVVAEALERGKRVITTDGAPAWSPSESVAGDKGGGNDYGGRLTYLRGFRDGTNEERVALLRGAIERV